MADDGGAPHEGGPRFSLGRPDRRTPANTGTRFHTSRCPTPAQPRGSQQSPEMAPVVPGKTSAGNRAHPAGALSGAWLVFYARRRSLSRAPDVRCLDALATASCFGRLTPRRLTPAAFGILLQQVIRCTFGQKSLSGSVVSPGQRLSSAFPPSCGPCHSRLSAERCTLCPP